MVFITFYKISEVIKMCVSNHFIEQQAYKMTEVIKGITLYKFVGVDFSGGEGAGFQKLVVHENEHHDTLATGTALITKVLLEDKDGTRYLWNQI